MLSTRRRSERRGSPASEQTEAAIGSGRRRRRQSHTPLAFALLASAVLVQLCLLPLGYWLLRDPSPPAEPPIDVEVTVVDPPPAEALSTPRPQHKPRPQLPVRSPLAPLKPKEKKKTRAEKQLVKEKKLKSRLKMVEVANPESERPPPDARFLSDKNRRVERETRARVTNLVRDAPQQEQRQESKAERAGMPKRKVAETKQTKARPIKRPTPRRKTRRSPLMAMRRQATAAQRAVDRAPPVGDSGQRAAPRHARAGPSAPSLDLDHRDFDQIYGAEAHKQRELARTSPSSAKGGRISRRWQRLRSALENFVPEVQPGNQTALGTRADPFAVYIARMHRTIHRLWGFGFLEDLDRKSNGHPLNDMNLWTMIEIVVQPDGSVKKATIVKPSGNLPFDTAALDTVFSASPYAPAPRAIRSADGNVYVHWRFHRNHRQCGTFGVDPYILTKPPAGPIDSTMEEVGQRGAPRPRVLRQLNRQPARGNMLQPMARAPRPGPARRGAARQAPPTTPALKGRSGPATPDLKGRSGPATPALKGRSGPATPALKGTQRRPRGESELAAASAIDSFLEGFRDGDPVKMAAQCALPFAAHGKPVASSQRELKRMFKDLIAEVQPRTTSRGGLMTPVEARGKLGRLPEGVEYGEDILVSHVNLGTTAAIFVLRQKNGRWSISGLNQ